MSFSTKKKIVCVLLAAMCLWPLAHHGVVRAFDLNPWKWFGWAMYTVPPPRVRARAASLDDMRWFDIGKLPEDRRQYLNNAYDRFTNRRMQFGARVEPDQFARAVFRVYPSAETIQIDVQDVGMDRATATIVELALTEYRYSRSDVLP